MRLCLILWVAGCQDLGSRPVHAPSVFESPAPESTYPETSPTPDEAALAASDPVAAISEAERLLRSGDYAGAARSAARVLACCRDALGDRALYVMGIARVHPGNPEPDPAQALSHFQRIVRDFPGSDHRPAAQAWTAALLRLAESQDRLEAVKGQMDQLNRDLQNRSERIKALKLQIEQLKAVDLETEAGSPAQNPAVP